MKQSNWERSIQQLNEEIDKRFQVHRYRTIDDEEFAEFALPVQGGTIDLSIIDWDKSGSCRIRYSYLHSGDYIESILTELYKCCIIIKDLYAITKKLPLLDYFEREELGDLDIEIYCEVKDFDVGSVLYMLEAFHRIDLNQTHIDKPFLSENYPELFDLFSRESKKAQEKFKRIAGAEERADYSSYVGEYAPVVSNLFSDGDHVYSNYNQELLVGFTQEGIERYIEKYQLDLCPFSDFYKGITYNILAASEAVYVWETRLWREAYHWLSVLELHYHDLPVYIACGKGRVLIRVVEFWVCIMAEADKLEEKIMGEKQLLQTMKKKYLQHTNTTCFAPDHDLYQLSPSEFEELCCDLLRADGYQDVHRRGALTAPDNGIDIEAVEMVRGIHTQEEKKWIFQCKRSKKMDRKDLSEISCLLREFQADRYGLFYAGDFKPSVIDRSKSFGKGVVWLYDGNTIKKKLEQYPDIAETYFPLYPF